MEEFALEELHGHHSEDEHEQHVDNEDVEDVLERVHHAVKHGLRQKERREAGAPVGSNNWAENIGGRKIP